ncbi:unnamed protein product [Haemonchus placei]|uniref:G_PROTEIN_RECEP_F1_2 domain-containing protein n=1 Tax=Haemonchus placei TaxID=6290 RepID=A0A0N4WYP5_HAEPC|nr:unnamed protein product [Haemonchus placei]
MVHEVVHKEPLYRTYTASTASFAYATKLLFDFIRILLPLTIIFATHVSFIQFRKKEFCLFTTWKLKLLSELAFHSYLQC